MEECVVGIESSCLVRPLLVLGGWGQRHIELSRANGGSVGYRK